MTLKQFYEKYSSDIDKAIELALREDKVFNDVTTKLILPGNERNRIFSAALLCKEECIAAGIDIFKRVYRKVDPKAKFICYVNDGDSIGNKQNVLVVRSTLANLLAVERTALNFIQRMSGVATLTHYFVKRLKFRGSKILHTRKTTPNFRIFELAAVKIGGGDFHRLDLGSAVLIKDNHICSAGSVENVLKMLRKKKNLANKTEIEVKTKEELRTVIRYGKGLVDTVMLDNFNAGELKYALGLLKKNGFKIEISGGINKSNFMKKQLKGIDYYSIGMLTHSYKSIDFSLEF